MNFRGKRILITGGTGSMGQTLVRRLLSLGTNAPEKIIVMSRDEAKQHDMRVDYLHRQAATDAIMYDNFKRALEFRIGDVRNYADVVSALQDCDSVIHAAALKQVPVCEYFSDQAIMTNCIGPMNIVRAIREHKLPIETVVGVSTDKACEPINVMGMTKALQERIFIGANVLNSQTRFVAVRYGNVLASRGSVIPLFHDQILAGGPVTITDTRMTRFLISLEQAVDTVLEAYADALAGETYVPSAPGARMEDLAALLIGDRPIAVQIVGIRPGEKLDEVLISREEAYRTVRRGTHYVIRPMLPELSNLEADTAARPLEDAFLSCRDILSRAALLDLLEANNLTLPTSELAKSQDLIS
jgi:FlaA1/EpsC-like NDP-sugar epimerase